MKNSTAELIDIYQTQPSARKEELIELLGNSSKPKSKKSSRFLVAAKRNSQEAEIINKYGLAAYNFLQEYVDFSDDKSIIVSTTSGFNLKFFSKNNNNAIVNLKRINDIRFLNKFLQTANELLPVNGVFIGCAETKTLRKTRILRKYPPVLNYIYYTLDFILKRAFPKISFTKKIYFWLTNGRNRVLSQTEILGRLYSCGFEILKEKVIGNLYYFVARKKGIPALDKSPTYGPLINIDRIGKDGKIIRVYKFRTMHPFAEYIQDYVYREQKLASGGKFRNDFRVTTIGKFMRRLWIDELPMIYNLLKGDVKIFGVRPLSRQYFMLYPEDYRKMRIKYKPGLVPPFYKDLPNTLEEIIESEKIYLRKYDEHPFRTDLSYLFKALHNIIFKSARSS